MMFSLGYCPKFFVVLYSLSEIFVRNCLKSSNFGPKIKCPKLNHPKFLGITVFQEVCAAKIDWDVEFEGELRSNYFRFVNKIEQFKAVFLPQYIFE